MVGFLSFDTENREEAAALGRRLGLTTLEGKKGLIGRLRGKGSF